MIDIIPAGASAVVSERHHGHDDHHEHDSYKTSERVKDRIAALDTANAERTASIRQDDSSYNTANAERTASIRKDASDYNTANAERISTVRKDVSDYNTENADRVGNVRKDISDFQTYVTNEVREKACQVKDLVGSSTQFLFDKSSVGFSAAALASAQNTASILQAMGSVDKDVQLLGKDLQIAQRELALGAAQNTAALQMTACTNQSMTMLAFKDAALQLAQVKADLSREAAECCCELKQEIGSVKDSMKQQEIDRLREQLLDAKARSRRRFYSPLPAGTLAAGDDD